MPVNSGYRNPIKNDSVPNSAPNSRHIYGDAADIGRQDWNNDGKVDRKDQEMMETLAENEDAWVEKIDDTPTWVHMDWGPR